MTIAHLFNKVYLSFDSLYQPAFDNLLVTKNHYGPHESFLNKHISLGDHYGKHENASNVQWSEFFSQCKDRRTIVYADPENFSTIYFSLLKTINPYISKDNAIKILEIVMKRAEFCFVEFDIFLGGLTDSSKEALQKDIASARSYYNSAWEASQPMSVGGDFILTSMGLEYLVGRFWVDGRAGDQVKNRLEQMWWKTFVNWGEEYSKWYMLDWLYKNPTSSRELMLAHVLQDPDLSWIADPNLKTDTVDEFRSSNDWSVIEKIHRAILSNQHNGLAIEMQPQWEAVVRKDWNSILDKSDPMNLIAVGTEPTYRVLLNSWLISYFAAQSKQTLGEMVT
jgi:hypothetical protein